ncbi:MAG: transcription antitermination factor NusB [Alphaproteobacteria bacterium]|jgi:N utilization substance protein B|nr:transcription antitermination factor NusB [Alphaproteobacteria bacterium]
MGKFNLHKRSVARIAAVQVLYQCALIKENPLQVLTDFPKNFEQDLLKEVGSKNYSKDFLSQLVLETTQHLKDIDLMIEKALPETWSFNRLDLVLLCILRVGVYELWKIPETDSAVIINEYLNVTHAFYGDKEPGFVNGILHTISSHLRGK